jgi:hypothetical protein
MRRECLSGLDDSLEDEGEQENSYLEDINHEEVLALRSTLPAESRQPGRTRGPKAT